MENEIIKVEDQVNEVAKEVAKKVEFTNGEKAALTGFAVAAALFGYAAGKMIVEPVVKKAAGGVKNLVKGLATKEKSEETKEIATKEEKTDNKVDDILEEVEVEEV